MPKSPNPQSIVNVAEGKIVNSSKKGRSKILEWLASTWRAILSEFLATGLLLFLGCMTCIPIDGLPYFPPMYAAIGFGCIVMFNIQIFGHLSGAHMNPSVSLAAALFGKMTITTTLAYVVAQCLGAIFGYSILLYVSPVDMSGGVCVTRVHSRLNVWQAVIVEIILTSTLVFINCSVWDPVHKDKVESIPIKFGLAVAGLSMAGGPLTDASMNTARSLGPALITGIWTDFWIYCIGPLIAAILPVAFYKFIWLKNTHVPVYEIGTVSHRKNKMMLN